MQRRPLPVVICSIASDSGELAPQALEAGAIEFVQKPTALATEKVCEMSDELISKVKTAASIRRLHALPRVTGAPPHVRLDGPRTRRVDIVVLGISTGGPRALKSLLPQRPADFRVPLAAAPHMPVGYAELYARSLNELSSLEVKQARERHAIQPGTVLIAPAGRHLSLGQENGTALTHPLTLHPAAGVVLRTRGLDAVSPARHRGAWGHDDRAGCDLARAPGRGGRSMGRAVCTGLSREQPETGGIVLGMTT